MQKLIRVEKLTKYFLVQQGIFERRKNYVHAVDDVSFEIDACETLGLVGESGCGKSTVGMMIAHLIEPTMGRVFFDSQDIFQLDPYRLRAIRKQMGILFQDPYSSLNPRLQVIDIVAEPLKTHTNLAGAKLKHRVLELLRYVGLDTQHLMRYPHEFSGGQRQRIAIARALALNPTFLVLDEPTSALDVSVQAQVLNLLSDLQKTFNIAYLFISHNLAVVKHISHRVVIMYLGKIVEIGPNRTIFSDPLHPYTKALISAVPSPDPDRQEEMIMMGDVPSPLNIPSGCGFSTRCAHAKEICSTQIPVLAEMGERHLVACHFEH